MGHRILEGPSYSSRASISAVGASGVVFVASGVWLFFECGLDLQQSLFDLSLSVKEVKHELNFVWREFFLDKKLMLCFKEFPRNFSELYSKN